MYLLSLFIFLLCSFILIAIVSDRYFIPSLELLIRRYGMRSDTAGATFMAAGSSAPELFIALVAILHPGGHLAIGVGTIVGSAVFNLLVIVGAVALVKKALLAWQPLLRDTLAYCVAVIALLMVLSHGQVTWLSAMLLIALYVVYLFAVFFWGRILPYKDDRQQGEKYMDSKSGKSNFPLGERWAYWRGGFEWVIDKTYPAGRFFRAHFFISIAWIAVLSYVLVESAVRIASILNIPQAIIALTVLAAGTSVPDLVTSVLVAKKGKGDMAISNALGSNIFDILLGLGIPWLIIVLIRNEAVIVEDTSLLAPVIMLLGSVVVFFLILMAGRWRVGRGTGFLLLLIYLAFLTWQVLGVILSA